MQSSRPFKILVLLFGEMNYSMQDVTERIGKTAEGFADIRPLHFLLHPM
ncbi:hypothetical protein [Cernens ardua]